MGKVLFIASLGFDSDIPNGVSVKNKHLYKYLKEKKEYELTIVDTENWKKNLWSIFFKILINSFKADKIILSINTNSANKIIKFLYLTKQQKKLNYFVVGGNLPDRIREKIYNKKHYFGINMICVETNEMYRNLESQCFQNVHCVPNFKFFSKIQLDTKEKYYQESSKSMKAFYLGRIHPDKGINMIFDALDIINKENNVLKVDFYGPIEENFEFEFLKRLDQDTNATYNGSINLFDNYDNYITLSKYDVFLFPTYWEGEGFPGVVIDSFIAGVPIIASDWKYNSEIVTHSVNGLIFQNQNLSDFIEKINSVLTDKTKLYKLSENAYKESEKYNAKFVLENFA
ncbi:glycosyltransferase family 4 protein [Vagococcus fluvialis]|uniref:glycosyltransferase family 4 protein n=1 Tax=Vagococcus fluvialis TaxID=2738 RepID=UPI003B217E14